MILLGNRLKELRKAANLTQQELGDMINVTKVSICCYEKGTRIPSLETINDLANVFHVNVDYLLGHDVYLVADQSDDYGIKLSKEEIAIVLELRKHPELHEQFINDPERVIKFISKKLR